MESTKEYLFKLLAPFWLFLISSLAFLGAVIWIIQPEREDYYDLHYILANVIMMAIGYFFAFYLSYKRIKKAKIKRGLNEKLLIYRLGMILRWTILYLVILFSIFCFIMTKEYIFVCATLFTIGVLFVGRSNVRILSDQLELTKKEKSVLKVPDAAI